MKRVLFYALIAVIAGGNLAAEPAWGQSRGSDEGGRQKDDKKGGKRGKQGGKKGDQKGAKKGDQGSKQGKKSKNASSLSQIVRAMQQELNLTKEQGDQIREIFQDSRSSGKDGDRELSKGDREEMASRLRDLQSQAKKANADGDRERARDLMVERQELMREVKGSSDRESLDPKMFEAVAQVLNDKQRPKFWHIVERYSNKDKGESGAQYLEILQGLNLSDEQGGEVARLYKRYTDDLKNVDESDRKMIKQVQRTFQDAIMDQLSEEQRGEFVQALKESAKKSKEPKRGGGKSGGKGQKGGKGGKEKKSGR